MRRPDLGRPLHRADTQVRPYNNGYTNGVMVLCGADHTGWHRTNSKHIGISNIIALLDVCRGEACLAHWFRPLATIHHRPMTGDACVAPTAWVHNTNTGRTHRVRPYNNGYTNGVMVLCRADHTGWHRTNSKHIGMSNIIGLLDVCRGEA